MVSLNLILLNNIFMFSYRKFKKTSHFEPRLPLMTMKNNPPYGLQMCEEAPDKILSNASVYNLENLMNNPELLKPLNPTVLSPSDDDALSVAVSISDLMQAENKE